MKNSKIMALALFTFGIVGISSAQSQPGSKETPKAQQEMAEEKVQPEAPLETQEVKAVKAESKTDHSTQDAVKEPVRSEAPPASTTEIKGNREE